MNTHQTALKRVSLFGAAPDSGNQGVTALGDATLLALANRGVREVAQFGFSHASQREIASEGGTLTVKRCVARPTRKIYRFDSLFALNVATRSRIRLHGPAKAILNSDAVLDLSAGDSLSDIYGMRRFHEVVLPKRVAIAAGIPLVLLPQTIGPFQSPEAKQIARDVLSQSKQTWARDKHSFAALQELLGERFDPNKHREGVDMAFLLQPREPAGLPAEIKHWLRSTDRTDLVGINVSGLIYNTPEQSKQQFELQADYRAALMQAVAKILSANERTKILLIPHVHSAPGTRESDHDACQELRSCFPAHHQARMQVVASTLEAAELKWLIGKLGFFFGTRMHSTIAGLSSGVPTACLSYSMKTRGVFECCGMSDYAIELRSADTQTVVDELLAAWNNRKALRSQLAYWLPKVIERANRQMDQIVYGEATSTQVFPSSVSAGASLDSQGMVSPGGTGE